MEKLTLVAVFVGIFLIIAGVVSWVVLGTPCQGRLVYAVAWGLLTALGVVGIGVAIGNALGKRRW